VPQNQTARLLRLLSLLQSRREWSGAELAARLQVTGRTIRRDIDQLRELGYPIEGTTGAAGGYRLRSGRDLPPLLLDDDEAIAIAAGLRTAAEAGIAGVDEASVRALAMLPQPPPPRWPYLAAPRSTRRRWDPSPAPAATMRCSPSSTGRGRA
jgi:predicted DNA-binding transcriptional regulator YafY